MFSCKTIKLKAKLCIEVWLWKEAGQKKKEKNEEDIYKDTQIHI